MPLHMAMALLSDERLDNTHPDKIKASNAAPSPSNAPAPTASSNTKYVSTVRKHSKKAKS